MASEPVGRQRLGLAGYTEECRTKEVFGGAGRGSAGVRSNVWSSSAKKEVTHTHYTCSESAHVQRVCVRGVCVRAVHAR